MRLNTKYSHNRKVHNLSSPEQIVPVIYDVIKPKSFVDIGGGIGNFTYIFDKLSVKDFNIIDGDWVDKNLLYVDRSKFITHNLEKPLSLDKRFDLAFCIEVAEHIGDKYSDILVSNIVGLSDLIVFSAAIPGQGGQNHVNEQNIDYWIDKFKKHNYTFYDVLRPIFWNNKKIEYWYRQNIFLVSNEKIKIDSILEKFKKNKSPKF